MMVLQILCLVLAAVLPVVLILRGKRLLGEQTHGAAVAILAWMGCAFVLSMTGWDGLPHGGIAAVWVALCYGGVAVWRRLRR